MYEPDDEEMVEQMALEGLSRRAGGSRFANRMPEEQRAGFTIVIGSEPSGGVEEDEGGPNRPSGAHVESNEPTTGATAMRKAHAMEQRHQGAGQSNQNYGPSISKQEEEEDIDQLFRRALRE